MGHRLSKIYTRTGDSGTTGLGDGSRVDKDDPRVEAIGTVDELNSLIGLLLTETMPQGIKQSITNIQHTLFDLGGELSVPGGRVITEGHVEKLETFLDQLNSELKPLKEFILPGGSRTAALCHVARSVCRRAERRAVRASREEDIPPTTLKYLNRLSDVLFVLSRYLNKYNGHEDVLWEPGKDL